MEDKKLKRDPGQGRELFLVVVLFVFMVGLLGCVVLLLLFVGRPMSWLLFRLCCLACLVQGLGLLSGMFGWVCRFDLGVLLLLRLLRRSLR